MVLQDHIHPVGADGDRHFSAAAMDHHIDLPFIQGNGNPADGFRAYSQPFEPVLDGTGGLSCPGVVVPGTWNR